MGRKRAINDPSVRVELSPRQRQVLRLMAAGATNGQIAEKLGLSLEGAKWHVREIFARLGVDSREEAVAWWSIRRRGVGPFAWSPIALFAGAGTAVVAVLAGVAVIYGVSTGGDQGPGAAAGDTATSVASPVATVAPTSTPIIARVTSTPLRPQPALREIAAGESWRLLVSDDGVPLPAASDLILAIGYDQEPPRVDLLDHDGRIAARLETGYQPMAHLEDGGNRLIVSDGVTPGTEGFRSRMLVFDLSIPKLLNDITLPGQRVNFTTFGDAIAVSPDGRWGYWIEHRNQPDCPNGGDEIVCDLMVIHPVNLATLEPVDLAAEMPRACAVPAVAPYTGSSIVAQCHERQGSRWVVDAGGPVDEFLAAAPTDAPQARWKWTGGTRSGRALDFSITNDGSLTSVTLRDSVSGAELVSMPVADTWGAFLLEGDEVIFLRSNGRLERVDLYTGAGTQLPYEIAPGRQGLDIILSR